MFEANAQSRQSKATAAPAMQVVYLDQNAASFLAKSTPGSIWREIREALADGFRNRKLICPLPFECVLETAPMPLAQRQSLQTPFWELSEGVAFESFIEMSTALLTLSIQPATLSPCQWS
jgi:hypothetical protein